VTAVLIDLGQPIASLSDASARATANGAESCIIIDGKDELCADYLAPAIRANAMYEGAYPLATALGRPLIAAKLVEVAHMVGADAVAHGCTGKGNDQVRIEATVKGLDPALLCIAPQRSHPMSRDEVLRYAARNNLQLPPLKNNPYSVDENLWGRSAEGHDAEDPSHGGVPETAFAWTHNPRTAPDTPATYTLTFEAGLPVALDGVKMPLAQMIAHLNKTLGAHGVGRIDHVENRLVGIKTREVYEAPAAIGILTAKRALETITLTRDEDHLKPPMEATFSRFVYDGKWGAPAMIAVRAFLDVIQENVTGNVTVEAWKGRLTVQGRTSPVSLLDPGLATYSDKDAFHHQASEGFIEIWSLPTEVAMKARRKVQVLP